MVVYDLKYLCSRLESPVLAVSPPDLICIPNFLASLAVQRAEKTLAFCKPYSTITDTSLSHPMFSTNPRHSHILDTVKRINHPSQNQHI